MKSGLVASILGGFVLVICFANCGVAQESAGEPSPQEQLMQKWVEFMTPGAEHALLKQRVGKWTVAMEMKTAPEEEPTKSSGTAEIQMIMGGRYLTASSKSVFDGQPFEGFSITAYDKLKKKFESIWIDNFGTGFTFSSGMYDAATKTFTYSTMSPDVAGGKYKPTKTLERVIGPDEWVLEIYDKTDDGQDFLMMKAVYRRDKS